MARNSASGERAGTDARLEHLRSGEDVGKDQDRAEVLRVDDLRAAWHLEHVLGERRSHRDEPRPECGAHGRTLRSADERVVFEHAGVRVELASDRERHEVTAALGVDEQHAVAGGERPRHSPTSCP